jgi:pilus assembly protein Flp/PilA
MKELLKRLVREEAGQDMIEYALLAGFISLVAVTAITQISQGVGNVYGNLNTQVQAIPGAGGS